MQQLLLLSNFTIRFVSMSRTKCHRLNFSASPSPITFAILEIFLFLVSLLCLSFIIWQIVGDETIPNVKIYMYPLSVSIFFFLLQTRRLLLILHCNNVQDVARGNNQSAKSTIALRLKTKMAADWDKEEWEWW